MLGARLPHTGWCGRCHRLLLQSASWPWHHAVRAVWCRGRACRHGP
ncbi:hypothetical protein SCATT_29660 [Streptantibioticus cattleyicolor NRRL 8057 = DSM 46488]|uniref:Uncharacterized protein n=1 Tax=Streptantibioticus cattleyicolor (strain ATCC 35852 / DSM 46488 / JCM 4925 / NBRC 14057 / NRRL 8057) TaxID=1003195 RepID=G8WS96_STREN|nr:hypothetical protein SCATT_29660 [Streptantibioticus cattleyicolor NRRL 8057 = DSM 46488]